MLILQYRALLPSQISFTFPMEIRQLDESSLTPEYLLDNCGVITQDTCKKIMRPYTDVGKELKSIPVCSDLTVLVYSWVKFIFSSVNFLDYNSLMFLLFSVSFHPHQFMDSNVQNEEGLVTQSQHWAESSELDKAGVMCPPKICLAT